MVRIPDQSWEGGPSTTHGHRNQSFSHHFHPFPPFFALFLSVLLPSSFFTSFPPSLSPLHIISFRPSSSLILHIISIFSLPPFWLLRIISPYSSLIRQIISILFLFFLIAWILLFPLNPSSHEFKSLSFLYDFHPLPASRFKYLHNFTFSQTQDLRHCLISSSTSLCTSPQTISSLFFNKTFNFLRIKTSRKVILTSTVAYYCINLWLYLWYIDLIPLW